MKIEIERILNKIPHQYIETVRERISLESNESFDFLLEEFLKFISIQSITDPKFIPVNSDVDEIWHEFILQTNEYERFCKEILPGKRFIHHGSIGLSDYGSRESLGSEDLYRHCFEWLGLYAIHFGEFNSRQLKVWTALEFLTTEVNLSLDEINLHAAEIAHEIEANNQ